MVVAQQLADGQVIQTIEGPAADVSQLLSRRGGTSADGKLGVTVTEATPGIDQAMAMQLGDRMLAITGRPAQRQPAGDDPADQRGDAQQVTRA